MKIFKSLWAPLLAFFISTAHAGEIKIGFVSGFTGPIAATAQDVLKVVNAYVDMINSKGGINGNKLTLVTKDDGYDSKKTVSLFEEAIVKDRVIGFVNSAGTGSTIALIKSGVLNKYKSPLVGVFSGSEALRGPGSDEIFHTRATYNDEIMRISRLASTLGMKKVAVLYQDDAMGQGVMQSVTTGAKDFQLNVTLSVPYKAGTKDFTQQAKLIEAQRPQAIFLLGVPDSTYQFMKVYGAPQGASQIYALSFVSPSMLVDIAGEAKSRGIGISQVVPNPHSASLPLIRDYQVLISSPLGKGVKSSPVVMEGYLNIRILVEAIRLSGANPTSEKVMQSLSSMHNYLVGGYLIDFSKTKRNGSDFLDIAVVGHNAHLLY